METRGEPCLLSTIPATWIDKTLLECPTYRAAFSSRRKFCNRALSTTVSVTLFPLCLVFDSTRYSSAFFYNKVRSYLSSSPGRKSYYQRQAEITNQVAIKCIESLFCYLGEIPMPGIVSNHFLVEPKDDGKIHPFGSLYVGEGDVRYPTIDLDVVNIVREAIENEKSVSCRGAGMCQGKQTLPVASDDIMIDMSKIKHVELFVELDEEGKEITIAKVGAGATWSDIQNVADGHAKAVQVMQASNVFSVGGSISINCHGWDHKAGSLVDTVHAITIVDANGEIQRLTKEDVLFQHVVSGLGCFGVILEAEIILTENQDLYNEGEEVSIDDYPDHYEALKENDYTKMHLYRLSLEKDKLLKTGWVQNYNVRRESSVSDSLVDEPDGGTRINRILINVARRSSFFRTIYWKQTEKDLSEVHKGSRNEIMRPDIKVVTANNSISTTEWLQEYFVPKDKLSSFLTFLSDVLNKNDVALMNASVRFVKQDHITKLGYATGGDRFAIVLFFNQSLNKDEVKKTKTWVREVVDELIRIDGTFYLPYMQFATKEQFRSCYPAWAEVKEFKDEYDPNCVFKNGFYEQYFA